MNFKNLCSILFMVMIPLMMTCCNTDDDMLVDSTNPAGVPLYYMDYLQEIEEKIQKEFLLSEPLSDAFTFITDVHYPFVNGSGFKIMRHLLDNTPIDKAICGGDINGVKATDYGDDASIIEAIAKSGILYERDCALVRASGKPMFSVRGNHDYALKKKSGTDGNSSWFSDWTSTRNIIMNSMEQYGIVTNYDDNKACYFYIDYPARKLRYIYVDAVDTNEKYGEDNNSMVIGLSDTQIQWLIEKAVMTTPQDHDIVFISHISPEAIVGGRETIDGRKNASFNILSNMLLAIQEKKVLNITLNSVVKTYDLTSYKPNILLYKSGHLHREGVAWYGYWAYATGCEWANGGNELAETKEYIHFGIDTSRNTQTAKGSIYESLVDAILINGRKNVLSFRIGAGVNRIFQQHQIVISSGSTITLESSLGKNVKWWCYDSQNYDDGQEWYQIILKNDNAEINANTGILSAKAVGYVTVMAYDETKNTIEYLGVKVEDI